MSPQDQEPILEDAELNGQSPAQRLLELAGSGLWEGDLAEMRDDLNKLE
jgi:hypothetical protein